MKNFVLNTTFSRNKTCRDNNRSLSCLFQRIDNVLDKTGIYCHGLFLFSRYIRNSSPKASRHSSYLLSSIGKIHFERRITYHKIKLAQLLSVIALMIGAYKSITLNGIIERRYKSVKQ